MAQTGFTPIQLYSSSTTGNTPAAADLLNSSGGSELAINIFDGKLFYKDSSGNVQVIGWKVVPVSAGGTGQTSYTDGQLLIGNSTGNTLTKATLTAGSGVAITNGAGAITISATGGTGDVVGPSSATDNAIARFDTTTGKLIQNSVVTVSDTGAIAGATTITDLNYLDFNTAYATTLGAGQLGWNGNDTLGLGMIGGNVIQHIGEDQFFYVKASSAITKGQLCMFTGAVGASGVLTAAPSNSLGSPQYVMGFAAEDIALNAFGLVQCYGTLRNVNTSAYADGDVLYYNSAVTGGTTNVYPTSGFIITVAAVTKGGSVGGGSINIRITVTQRITASTGISVAQTSSGSIITNTAPDQVVSLTGAGTTTISGTYPSFTITSNDAYVGTVTSVGGTGSVNGITLTGTVTSSGNLTLGGTLSGIGNSQLTNSTISGVALGGSLFNLTAGTGVTFSTGTTYNGSAAITINATGTGGTVTSVAALTLGTTGTDLSSTVANGTTTPVITLNVPTASATNRGALSAADWTTFNNKAPGVTFTTNYIPYGQGTTTLNQSAGLQFDGTNFTTTGAATAARFIPSGSTVPTNGLYLPATNAIGWATNSTAAMRVDASQNLLINQTTTYPNFGKIQIRADSTAIPTNQDWSFATPAGNAHYMAIPTSISSTQSDWMILRGTYYGDSTTHKTGLVLQDFYRDNGQYGGRYIQATGGNLTFGQLTNGTYATTNASLVEHMRLDDSGRLLLNTTTTLNSNDTVFTALSRSASTSTINSVLTASTTGISYTSQSVTVAGTGWYHFVGQSGNGSVVNNNNILIFGNGNVQNANNSYGGFSDVKLKENIVYATAKLEDLCKVQVRNYNLIGEDTKQIGVIAQELEEVFPGLVENIADRDLEGNILDTTTKSVKYSVFIPMLIKAIQELKAEIDLLKGSK